MADSSRLFVDFSGSGLAKRRRNLVDKRSLPLTLQRFAPPDSPLETRNEAPSSLTLPARARARVHIEKPRKRATRILKIDKKRRKTRNENFNFNVFFFFSLPGYAWFHFLFTSKKLETRPDMIARLGLSRPEKSRGRHFKSPSFVLFSFFFFLFLKFFFFVLLSVACCCS